MNIWYFHHYATPASISGLHRPFEFGAYFREQGHEVSVFTSSYLHYCGDNMIEDSGAACRIEDYDGIHAVYVRTCGYASSGVKRVINMGQFYLGLFPVARRYAAQHGKPDVIIASSPHPLTMLAGIQLAKKYRVPCLCEVRDFWPEVFFFGGRLKPTDLLGRILLWGERWIYQKCDALVFLKEGDHTYINEQGWDKESGGPVDKAKCYYVNNGVDLKVFDQNMQTRKIEDPDLDAPGFKVVYCGTIRPVNHVDMLLDVGKILTDKATILIYGDGNCAPDMRRRIEEENITNVKMKGYVSNLSVPYILSKASVSVLNYSAKDYNWSRGNSSNKLFEYLASGKPVVSTVKMGYDILERHSCGFSAEECTPESLAAEIEKVMQMPPEEYEAVCARARAAAQLYDIPVLAQSYLDILQKEIEKHR